MGPRYVSDGLFHCLKQGVLPASFALMGPDYVVHNPLFPEPIRGKEAVTKVNEHLFKTFPDLQLKVLDIASNGEVVLQYVLSGTFKGPLYTPRVPYLSQIAILRPNGPNSTRSMPKVRFRKPMSTSTTWRVFESDANSGRDFAPLSQLQQTRRSPVGLFMSSR